MQQCNIYAKREKIMSVIHAFICNENNLIFNSKLAIYHQYINSIEDDRIPTSSGKPQVNMRYERLNLQHLNQTKLYPMSCVIPKWLITDHISIANFKYNHTYTRYFNLHRKHVGPPRGKCWKFKSRYPNICHGIHNNGI